MSEKILSDGEMDALMEGMADGLVEVVRDGGNDNRLVRSFEIRPQNYLRFGSYPALSRLNEAFAASAQRYLRQTLGWPVSCDLARQYECTAADVAQRFDGLQHIMGFRLEPLAGLTYLAPDPALTTGLVEVFFGSTAIPPIDPTIEEYSAGQKRTAQRFAEVLMGLLVSAWEPVVQLTADFENSWAAIERVPLGGPKSAVIVSDYQIVSDEFEGCFSIMTASDSLGAYLDQLDGAERPGSDEQNRRWRATLERHVFELPVTLTVCNGDNAISLASFKAIEAGVRLPIADPNPVTVRCGSVALYTGNFGIASKRRVVRIDAAL